MKDIINDLKEKYNDFEEEKIQAVFDYVFMTFCFLSNQPELVETDLREIDKLWIKSACIEVLERSEYELGVISYSELGYSVTFDSGSFSKGLKDLVFPKFRTWG